MGVLGEALRQLDGRSPETLAAAMTGIELPEVAEPLADISFVEPLALDYADLAVPHAESDIEPADEPEASAAPFTDPSFNDALAFADAAIQVADVDEEPVAWPVVEMPTFEPVAVERVLERCHEPETRDFLATVAVDRSYGRLWDSLTSAMIKSPPWTIVVSAADSREDSCWLLPAAVAFAQRHPGEVLLVDAATDGNDAKRGGLSDHLGLACRFGLSDVLQSTADWRDAAQPTAVPCIDLLSRGPVAWTGDSALKASAANLLAELRSTYQLVLIWAGDARDPLVAPLVAASDGTLLLLELGHTSRAAAERASSSLYVAGARLLGCVLRG